MTYDFGLFPVAIAVGLLLLLGHMVPLFAPSASAAWLRALPRSLAWGRGLLVAATAWAAYLLLTMDLGEFAGLRQMMMLGTLAAAALTWVFVQEFLAVRALSILLLLGAEILLCAAFLRPESSRLLLVFLAYGWIFAGLFWVGLPWLFRDMVDWVTGSAARLRLASVAGALYGALILICAVAFFRH